MHAIINTYRVDGDETHSWRFQHIRICKYKQILPHCVAPPKCATLFFFALPSAVAGRHAPRLHRHHIVLRPTALSLKLSCAVLCCAQNGEVHLFITRMMCSHYIIAAPAQLLRSMSNVTSRSNATNVHRISACSSGVNAVVFSLWDKSALRSALVFTFVFVVTCQVSAPMAKPV